MDKTVGIVIPTTPHNPYIGALMDSIIGQTYKKIVISISGQDSLASYVENVNTAASRIIDECDYIFRADVDDVLEPTLIERLVAEIGDYDAIMPIVQKFGEDNGLLVPEENVTFERIMEVNPLVAFTMYTKEAWTTIGGYSTDVTPEGANIAFEDWEAHIKFIKAGLKYKVLHEPLYRYRIHAEQTGRDANRIADLSLNLMRKKHEK